RAADRARVPRGVLTGDVRAVARVGRARVPVLRARCPVRFPGVGWTVGPVPRAALGQITLPHRRAADGARGLEEVGRAAGTGPRARLGDVARPGRGAADRPRVARVVDARRRADRAVT